jgi:tRNA threonylcarbamoyladenosine modification (KEOPS) complex Cgi121 subunit
VEPKVGSGHLKTENIEDVKSLISSDFAVINPKVVCGIIHLKQAAYLATKAHEDKYNLAKEKSTEVLLYLTAQRQISKAIEIGGVNSDNKSIAWVSFGEIPKNLDNLIEFDDSIISYENFDYSITKWNTSDLKKLNFEEKQKIIMTRTATLPVQSR